MRDKKKAILINGESSNWYEQVIFIVKDNKDKHIPENLAREAEKIIDNHIKYKYNKTGYDNINIAIKNKENKVKGSMPFLHIFLNISLVFTMGLLFFLLYKIAI